MTFYLNCPYLCCVNDKQTKEDSVMLDTKIQKELTNDEYRAIQGWSSTQIKSVVKHSVRKALIPIADSDALRMGRAFHTVMESVEAFDRDYAVFDDTEIVFSIQRERPNISVPSMTKEYKQARKQFEQENQGKEIVSLDDFNTLLMMRENAFSNPQVEAIMQSADKTYVEQSYRKSVHIDSHQASVLVKARPDLIVHMGNSSYKMIDWKSCRDASPKGFRSDFFKYRYDVQAVVYCDVVGIDPRDFLFVALEKEAPYLCAVYGMTDEVIEVASRDYENALVSIARYENEMDEGGLTKDIVWI